MASKIKLSPREASAAVRSKAVLLVFVCCLFIIAHMDCGVIALLCSTLCPSSFAMISLGEKEWVALLLMAFDGICCY